MKNYKFKILTWVILVNIHLLQSQVIAAFTSTLGAAGSVSLTDVSTFNPNPMQNRNWHVYEYFNQAPATYTSANVVHTWSLNGVYRVALIVADNLWNSDSTFSNITITNTTCSTMSNLSFSQTGPQNYIGHIWGLGNIVAANWNWGDSSPITSGLAPSHTYSTAGTYTVCVSYTNSCGASTTICQSNYFSKGVDGAMLNLQIVSTNPAQTVFGTTTSLNSNVRQISFDVYPNPASDNLKIHYDNTNLINKISLFNSLGSKVYENDTLNSSNYNLDINNYPNGIYYLKVNNSITKKIVIAR